MSETDKLTGKFSHLNEQGEARMVDISGKPATVRRAIAEGMLQCSAETLAALASGGTSKGDALAAARIAGILAAKRTGDLIPLCHPLPLSSVTITFHTHDTLQELTVRAEARTNASTGVEMEALMAVSVALLTLYDMLKSMDKAMVIHGVRLLYKSGGNSGTYQASGFSLDKDSD